MLDEVRFERAVSHPLYRPTAVQGLNTALEECGDDLGDYLSQRRTSFRVLRRNVATVGSNTSDQLLRAVDLVDAKARHCMLRRLEGHHPTMLILDRAFCIRRHSPAAMGSGDRSRKINWMALITRSDAQSREHRAPCDQAGFARGR
ncbi:MAG: hypothetical protein IPF99_35585 [Deltaproteobacteria bacterium]|nr:hypothetical protein [Deltaproteobacteria bacterium]